MERFDKVVILCGMRFDDFHFAELGHWDIAKRDNSQIGWLTQVLSGL
ncbi:MAG: hypothetical protein ACLRPV_11815 [Lacrimispora saccharolytica]